ncbi:ribonuclease P protein component [Corynebacterium xerosis]|uniref:Ribonuclease P protein component n=1 Tax=Corynebacterium xerosis TaxID=1725 RepID=A0A2N6SXG9_9CORY|nr:ribonuclease P protein component [Corynebacterium xerosis]NMF08780.1 ribonuclease P protein component [Corynebacterium xerosis]PMC61772.1 ribonuclease P protein component [Corynebacterium xerosis]HJG57467.1 ribonuclease P protein component [Corynebacterium xerosis]
MLPSQHKLHRSGDFAVTVRRGRRLGRRTIVLHYRDAAVAGGHDADAQISRSGGPRVGFVVSKGVGNSVVRHAVTRKLRHVVLPLLDDVPSGVDMVIRALPAAATATSEELAADVRKALSRARRD